MHDIEPAVDLAATDSEINSTFDVMVQLRPHLTAQAYLPLIKQMHGQSGYRLAYVKVGSAVMAVAGFRMTQSLAWGQFIYVDDLISDEKARSSGYGEALLKWIAQYGKEHGCTQLHLDSGVQRHAAHRFYLRERLDITCYHFCRTL